MRDEREPLIPPGEGGSPLTAVAGAIIWMLHFLVVYLVAEARCSPAFSGFQLAGTPGVTFVTIAATIVGLAAIGFYSWGSWRRWTREQDRAAVADQERMLGQLGVITGAIFAVATLSVGAIVLALPPC